MSEHELDKIPSYLPFRVIVVGGTDNLVFLERDSPSLSARQYALWEREYGNWYEEAEEKPEKRFIRKAESILSDASVIDPRKISFRKTSRS